MEIYDINNSGYIDVLGLLVKNKDIAVKLD
jgi:hypothetical protein